MNALRDAFTYILGFVVFIVALYIAIRVGTRAVLKSVAEARPVKPPKTTSGGG